MNLYDNDDNDYGDDHDHEEEEEEVVPLTLEMKPTSSSSSRFIVKTRPTESRRRRKFTARTIRGLGNNTNIRNHPYLIVVIGVLLTTNILTVYKLWMTTPSTSTTTTTTPSGQSTDYQQDYHSQRHGDDNNNNGSSVIYGHIHMAKTAGTTINGELASHFERVCGHKGYSYDAYQLNERLRQLPSSKRTVAGPASDLYRRGQVPVPVMAEIGHEDCDWISYEVSTTVVWRKIASRMGPLEVHVPCRDPVDHLLSQCNYKHHQFDCSAKNYTAEIEKCLVWPGRFQNNIMTFPNTTVKCFNPIPIDGYVKYMSTKLQRKRIENQYVHRETNLPRNKTSECLSRRPKTAAKVRDVLITQFDYYNFCDSCMSSPETNLLY